MKLLQTALSRRQLTYPLVGMLVAGAAVTAYVAPRFVVGINPASNYVSPILYAPTELENLQRIVNNPYLTPVQLQTQINNLLPQNREGMQTLDENGQVVVPGRTSRDANGRVIDATDLLGNTVPLVVNGEDGSDEEEEDSSVPGSVGFTVGQYTYAGFKPSSITRHLNETRIAVGGKDWVYRYLVNGHIDPNDANWANVAAAALNAQYNTTEFYAIGQTLLYGDEFVRSTKNGYGLVKGQYDPDAKGQFFWGTN